MTIVNVHESTIRRTLNVSGVCNRVAKKESLLSKKNIAAVYGLLKISQMAAGKMFCGRMRPNSNFLVWKRSVLFGIEQSLHSSIRSSSHLWNAVAIVSWFRPSVINRALSLKLYQIILQEKVKISIYKRMFSGKCVVKKTKTNTKVVLPKKH